MKRSQQLARLALAAALIGSLGACTVVPAYPVGRPPPGYIETYPTYVYPGATYYYGSPGYRHYDGWGDRRYDDRRYQERRYEEPRREMPLPPPLQLQRDVRRGLGLPRLPGMP